MGGSDWPHVFPGHDPKKTPNKPYALMMVLLLSLSLLTPHAMISRIGLGLARRMYHPRPSEVMPNRFTNFLQLLVANLLMLLP